MVTITSLAKDDRAARIVLAATLEPDDAVTGRLTTVVGAVETVRLAAGRGAFPKKVDAVEAELWRRKVAPRLDPSTVTRALSETDRHGLGIIVPGDTDWPAALNDLGERAPATLWVRGAASFLTAPLDDRVTMTGARAGTSYGEHATSPSSWRTPRTPGRSTRVPWKSRSRRATGPRSTLAGSASTSSSTRSPGADRAPVGRGWSLDPSTGVLLARPVDGVLLGRRVAGGSTCRPGADRATGCRWLDPSTGC